MFIDFQETNTNEIYNIFSNCVYPRPIAWILTQDKVLNLAPFSYFIPVSSNPPTFFISIGQKKDKSPKDTLANLLNTKKATICIPNQTFIKEVENSAFSYEKNISEVNELKLETTKILDNFPPIIKGVQIAFFATLREVLKLNSTSTPLFLDVKSAFLDDKIIDENSKITALTLGRVGDKYISEYKIIHD